MNNILYLVVFFSTLNFNHKLLTEHKKTKKHKMTEKFDFEVYKKFVENDGFFETNEGHIIVSMCPPVQNGIGFQKEILPKPSFLYLYKEFYPNGFIKQKSYLLNENTKIDKTILYNESGEQVKEIDENTRFKNIKSEKILDILYHRGFINIYTGEGRFNTDGSDKFDIIYDLTRNLWYINIIQGRKLNSEEFLLLAEKSEVEPSIWKPITLIIDGETGHSIDVDNLSKNEKNKLTANPQDLVANKQEKMMIIGTILLVIIFASVVLYLKFGRKG